MIRTRAFASLLAATMFVGCASKQQTTLTPPPPEPNPEPQLATDARQRVQHLGGLAEQYAASAAKLPGSNEQQDRQQVAEQFNQLSQILPLLNGPDMPGDFRQQLRIIESTRSQLSSGSMDLSSEPTVDTGLRAAQRALSSLQQRAFAEQGEIAKHVDAMRAAVQELDTVSGPIHRLVVAKAFQHSAEAVKAMSDALNQRIADGGGTKPAAATPPAQPTPPPPAAAKPEQPATPTPTPPAQPTPPDPKPEQPKAETPAPKPEQPAAPTPQPEQPKPAQPTTPPPPELNK
jgi:hypothetical protein